MHCRVCWLSVILAVGVLTSSPASRAILTDFESPVPVFESPQGTEAGCKVELSTEQAHSGKHSVKITYDYIDKPGIQYEALGTSLPLVGRVSAVSAWLLGNGSGLPVVLRVTDTGGEVHQFRWGQLDFTGWRELTAELKNPICVFGGDGNQKIDWPLRLTQAIIDRGPQPAKGAVYVDDICYETDANAREFVTATVTGTEPGNVYVLGKRPARLTLEVRNGSADATVEGTLRVRVSGPGIWEPQSDRVPCRLGPGERLQIGDRNYTAPRPGMFHLNVTLETNGEERVLAEAPFCVLPDEGDTKLDPTSLFGACTHFGQGKGRIPDTFQLMSRAGLKWLRDEWSWGAIERQKGVYAFPEAADAFFRGAREYGITPLIIFDYGNPLYDGGNAPTSDEAQAAFGEYCYQLVSHYKGLCSHWEVYNEPNIGFWQPKPDPVAYARLLKIAYAACKRADPTCTVVGVCTAGTDLKYIRTVLENSGPQYMDALSIHPYRYPASPEASKFVAEVRAAHDLLAEFGAPDKRVWLTEIGWPTHVGPGGVSEQVSAQMLVRMYVQAMSLPFIGPIIWYDFQNDGLDAKYNECNFGLIRWDDFTAKENYLACRMMTRALAGKAFRSQVQAGEGVYAYVFGSGNDSTLVVWYAPPDAEKRENPTQTVAFRLDCKKVWLSRIDGEMGDVVPRDGTLPLTLTASPVFVQGSFRDVRMTETPLELKLSATSDVPPGSVIEGTLTARGLAGQEVKLSASAGWALQPAKWTPKTDREQTAVRLSVPVATDPGIRTVKASCAARGALWSETSAVVDVPVAEPLERVLEFKPAGQGLGLVWSVRNRTAVDLNDALATLTVPGQPAVQAQAAGLAKGASLQAHLLVSQPSAGPAVACEVESRFTCREGISRTIREPVNVWSAPRLTSLVSIDGRLDDWPPLPVSLPLVPEAVPMDGNLTHGRFAAIDNAKWSGPDDLSAKIGVAYDEKRLYLAVDVTDDQHVQPETGSEVWKGDGIQFAVDFDPTRRLPPAAPHQVAEIGLALGAKGPEVFRWTPFGPEGAQGPITDKVSFAAVRTGTHTVYEAAIPWETLLAPPDWRPPATGGTVVGFALVVNDNDGSGRKGWLQLFGGIGYGKDPTKYGLLILA